MRESLSNGLQALLRSRKFLTLAADFLFSALLYFAARYLAPAALDDVRFVIVGIQPLVALVIAAWAVEDVVEKITVAMRIRATASKRK